MTNEEKETIIKVFNTLLDKPLLFKGGLCRWVENLFLTDEINTNEYLLILNYLDKYLPKTIVGGGIFKNIELYCWEYGVILHRINWINEQIKILQNEKD